MSVPFKKDSKYDKSSNCLPKGKGINTSSNISK